MGFATHKIESDVVRGLTRFFSSMVRGHIWGFRGRRMRHDHALIRLWMTGMTGAKYCNETIDNSLLFLIVEAATQIMRSRLEDRERRSNN